MFIAIDSPFCGSVLSMPEMDTRYYLEYEPFKPSIGSGQYIVCCRHCGGSHEGECHRVKAIEYHDNGQIKRVEYHDR